MMLQETQKIYENSKRSLDSLLREKSFKEVQEILKDKGIDINDVKDEDIETLVAAKVHDKKNELKGFALGAAFTLALSLFIGI